MVTMSKTTDLLQVLGFAEPKYLFFACTRPLVGTNVYVREDKALSSYADVSDLPTEDGEGQRL